MFQLTFHFTFSCLRMRNMSSTKGEPLLSGRLCYFSRWLNSVMQVPTTKKLQTYGTKCAASEVHGMWSLSDSGDFNHSFPMNGTDLPPLPTFSLIQAGEKVVCLVLDISSKMAEVTFWIKLVVKYSSFFSISFQFFLFSESKSKGRGGQRFRIAMDIVFSLGQKEESQSVPQKLR